MKILVVEDDRTVAQTLKLLLSSYSYAIDLAADGEAGLQMAEAFEYDLFVLDVMLPGVSGIELCQQLRAQGCQKPILLLTAQSGGPQKAIALNAGADDYVVKPFDAEELIARVQALLRRSGTTSGPILTWGQLAIDPSCRQVTYGTHLLSLTPKEYAILELLLRNPQRSLNARLILDHVWSSVESPGEEAIRAHIKELRHKLALVNAPKDFIKTVHRVGYRLNPMYSSFLATQTEQPLSAPQVAELKAVNEELRSTLEQLRSTQTELHQKNQELECIQQRLAHEQQQLQAARDALELRVAERTAELLKSNHNLLQQQQQWQALFDHALDAIVITDDNRHYIDANAAACELFGTSKAELLRSSIAQFADLTADFTPIWQQFRQQGQLSGEFRLHRPDGTVRETEFTAIAHFIPDRHLAILRDISERKRSEAEHRQAEAELSQREEFLSSIYTGVDQAIFVIEVTTDHDFRYLDFNPVAERYAGLTNQQIQGKTPEEAFGNVLGATFRQNYERCLTTGEKSSYEEKVVLENHIIWTLTTLLPLRNQQGIYRLIGTATDISDRKEAESNLQEISTALSNAVEGISRLDTQGHYLSVNEAYARMVGYAPSELIGMHWQNTVYADDIEMLTAAYEQMLQTGKVSIDARGIRKDGSLFYKQLVMVTAYDDQQQPTGHYCFMKDISERKQLEADRNRVELIVHQQTLREQLIEDISQDIRQSLDLQSVLLQAAKRVREMLHVDRALIYRFQPNWSGTIVAEAVEAGWTTLLSVAIRDPCFGDHYAEHYQQGKVSAVADVEVDTLTPCYAALLKDFQVRAHLVVPILQRESRQGDQLWGLLIVHQCTGPRAWQAAEIELLKQLANQLSMAIQQSELYEQTCRELQERQRAEAALRESEARYRLLFESNPNPMWVFDLTTLEFLAVNQAAIDHYGYAREDFLSMTIADIRPVEDLTALHETLATFAVGQNYLGVWQHIKRDGSVIDVEVLAHTFMFEGKLANLVMVTDITDRRKAEQKIREQAALLNIASDAIFVRDLNQCILYWNQGARRLYGWAVEAAIGQKANELLHEDLDQLATILQTLLEHGEWQGETRTVTQTGKEVITAGRWTLIRDDVGHPKFMLTVNTDITEKKHLEAQFYQAQRLESLGTLASGLAHDLNNVLTPILAISQLIRLQHLNLDDRAHELLRVLESSAERGAKMVKQILTFTRGTDGERTILQIPPLLQEVISVAQQTFPRAIAIQPQTPEDSLWCVYADPTHLHQVLMNLCVNARDAMPADGVLTVSAENYVVDAAFAQATLNAQAGNYVVITVTDTGVGIPPDVRDRIFEPFFTTKAVGQGTGLGLSTVLGLVKNMGGFVQVFSEVGSGSQFKVYLPATSGTIAETQSLTVPKATETMILIVDED